MKFIVLPLLMLIFTCHGQNNKRFTNYYFPVPNFLTEKTYCYTDTRDSSQKSFWKMKTTISKGDTIFETRIYKNEVLAEKMIERIHQGESNIISYTLYKNSKEANCKIIDSLVYRNNMRIGETIQWQISFKSFNSSNIMNLTKTRILESSDNEKQLFDDTMKVSVEGSSIGQEYKVKSVYKVNTGLISYKIISSGDTINNFVLTSIK